MHTCAHWWAHCWKVVCTLMHTCAHWWAHCWKILCTRPRTKLCKSRSEGQGGQGEREIPQILGLRHRGASASQATTVCVHFIFSLVPPHVTRILSFCYWCLDAHNFGCISGDPIAGCKGVLYRLHLLLFRPMHASQFFVLRCTKTCRFWNNYFESNEWMDENCYKVAFEVHLFPSWCPGIWDVQGTLRGMITSCMAFNWTIRRRQQQQLLCQGQSWTLFVWALWHNHFVANN